MIIYYIQTNIIIATVISLYSFFQYLSLINLNDTGLNKYKKMIYIKNEIQINLKNNYKNVIYFIIVTYFSCLTYPYFMLKAFQLHDLFKTLDYNKFLVKNNFNNYSLMDINNEIIELKDIVLSIKKEELTLEDKILTDSWLVKLEYLEKNLYESSKELVSLFNDVKKFTAELTRK